MGTIWQSFHVSEFQKRFFHFQNPGLKSAFLKSWKSFPRKESPCRPQRGPFGVFPFYYRDLVSQRMSFWWSSRPSADTIPNYNLYYVIIIFSGLPKHVEVLLWFFSSFNELIVLIQFSDYHNDLIGCKSSSDCRRPSWAPKTQLNDSTAAVWLSFWCLSDPPNGENRLKMHPMGCLLILFGYVRSN